MNHAKSVYKILKRKKKMPVSSNFSNPVFPTSEWISKCINDTGLYPSLLPNINTNGETNHIDFDFDSIFDNLSATDFPIDFNDSVFEPSLSLDMCNGPYEVWVAFFI